MRLEALRPHRTRYRLPGTLGLLLLLAACSSPAPDGDTEDAPPSDEPVAPIVFRDVTTASGIDTVQLAGGPNVDYIIDSIGAGAAWLDYDLDGDADLYLAQGASSEQRGPGPPDELWRNDGDRNGDGVPEFVEVAAEAGLGDTQWSFGVAVADYDADGDPDLYLTNWGRDRLYLNDGQGRFIDVAPQLGLDVDAGWGTSAAWADTDLDGDLDLYVTRYVEFSYDLYPARGERSAGGGPPCVWRGIEVYCGPRNLIPAADVFYENVGDRDGDGIVELVDATAAAGFSTDEAYYGLAVSFFDADVDGDPDLYVANDSTQNSFFVNDGSGRFTEEAIFSGVAYDEKGAEQAGMGVAIGDLDVDGLMDLGVSNFSHDHDTIYHNEGQNVFVDRSYVAGIGEPSWLYLAWGLEFFDVEHDGDLDLFVARGHVYPQVDGTRLGVRFLQRDALFFNDGVGLFSEPRRAAEDPLAQPTGSRSPLLHDIDGDGDLDLLVTELSRPPRLLVNEAADGHWLQVRLRGPKGNLDGLGARVELEIRGIRLVREVRRNNSFLGSTLPIAHFGLGKAQRVDLLRVRWPDGEVTSLEAPVADRVWTIEHPERQQAP